MPNTISEDTVDTFVLELYEFCVTHPLCFEDEDEGFENFHEFVHSRFDKFWSYMIKERNYN